MNTRSTTAYTKQGVFPKYAIVAFREPLTCAIYDIEKLDKPRKKVSGATIKVEVNDGLRKGTIVSTAGNFDTLVPKLKEFNILSFFGIRKQKGVPRATVVKKRGILEFQITSPQKRSKIDTKIQKTVPTFLASNGRSQPKSIKTVSVPTGFSPTPLHSDPNPVNELSSPNISSYDVLKSESSFSSDATDILNQQFFASPSSSENSSVESDLNVFVEDLFYLREPPRDVNDEAELSTLEHIAPTVCPEITRVPSPILPVPSQLRDSSNPSKFSTGSYSDKYLPSSYKTGLSDSSTPKDSLVRSMPTLVPSAKRLKSSSVAPTTSKLDKCSIVVSASSKPTKFPNAELTSSTSFKPSTIVQVSTKPVQSFTFIPQSSKSSIPQTITSTTNSSKVVKPSTILPTSTNVADLLSTKPDKSLTVMRCKPNELSTSPKPVKPSIVVPAPSKPVNSFAALPPTSGNNRPSAYFATELPTSPKQTTASTAVLPLFSKSTNALNVSPPSTVVLHKKVSQAKSSSGSVLESPAPMRILSDSSKPASRPPQSKGYYRQTMRYSPCSETDSRYSSNTDSYRPMSRYPPYQDTYLQQPCYSPYPDAYSRTPRMELFPRLFSQQTPEYHPPMACYRTIDFNNSIPPFPESPAWASSFEEFVPQLPLPPFPELQNLPPFPVTSTTSSYPMATERQPQNESQERLLVTDPRFMKLKVLNILGQKIDIEIIKKRIQEVPEEDVKEDKSLPYIISEEILKDSLIESDQIPERFAVKLLDRIFTLEELEGRNVYGTNHVTKGALDRRKIAAIDEAVKSIFPGTYHIWKICVNSINSHIRYVLQKLPQLYRKTPTLTIDGNML